MEKCLRLDFLKMIMEKLLKYSIVVFYVCFLLPFLAVGQSEKLLDYSLLHTLEISSPIFTTDQLRNVYTVTNTNEVVKYTPNGKIQFRYNNNTLGNLTFIDATDPFNLSLIHI